MRAQLPQRQREVAGEIRGNAEGLAGDGDAAGAAGGGLRMLVREFRILIDEACRHHQVLRDALGVLLAERLQFAPRNAVKLLARHIIRDARVVMARTILAVGPTGTNPPRRAFGCSTRPRTRSVLAAPVAIATRTSVTVTTWSSVTVATRARIAITTRASVALPSRSRITITSRSAAVAAGRARAAYGTTAIVSVPPRASVVVATRAVVLL